MSTEWIALNPPAVGDAVVMEHTKYRIRELDERAAVPVARIADAGPQWRRGPIVGAVALAALTYDRVAALWRVDATVATSPAAQDGPGSPGATGTPDEAAAPDGAPAPVASSASAPTVATADPGHCNVHGDVLRTAQAAGVRHYGWGADPAVWCPQATGHENDADPLNRARCRFCGGRLVPEGTRSWDVRTSRQYCSTTHRNYYFRRLQRDARARAAAAPAKRNASRRPRRSVAP